MRTLLASLALAAVVVTGCSPDDTVDPEQPGDDPTIDEQALDDQAGDDQAGDDQAGEPATSATDGDAGAGSSGESEPDPDDRELADDEADAEAANGPDEDAAAGERVSIDDFFFDTDALDIEVGETVIWTHDGRITHNVTSRDDSFASDNLGAGESFAHTFTAPGSFTYVCTLHSQMVATVQVG